MRGVSPRVLAVRDNVRIVQGRFFTPGLYELVVGSNAARAYEGLDLGKTVHIGPGQWKIVGVFNAGGSAFDSEIWADANVVNGAYQRPPGVYQSLTAKLRSEDDFTAFKTALERDPRAKLQATREPDYYESQSQLVTTLITVLGTIVAIVMGLGAILAALNTMYSAVSERSREIAILRALGFQGGSIVLSFLAEALIIAVDRRDHRVHRRPAGERDHHRHDQLADVLAPVVCVPDHARPAPVGRRVRDLHGRARRAPAGDSRGAGQRVDHVTGAVATPECRALASTAQASRELTLETAPASARDTRCLRHGFRLTRHSHSA